MADTEEREVRKAGWLERMGGSIKGVVIGFLLVAGAVVLVFWNEGRAVKTATRLAEGAGAVLSVPADAVNPANNGKLVHVSGKVETKDVLCDAAFGVSAAAIQLKRTVEISQWIEEKTTRRVKKGDAYTDVTSYSYRQEWCKTPVDSSDFHEKDKVNPPAVFPYSDERKCAQNVKLGAFSLSERDIQRIGGEKPFVYPADFKLPLTLKNGQFMNGVIYIAAETPSAPAPAAAGSPLAAAAAGATMVVSNAVDGAGRDVSQSPRAGDVRVKFEVVEPHEISIVEQQKDNTLVPWKASDGETLSFLREGLVEADAIFASAQSANTMWTWIWRVLGFLFMFTGFKMVFGPIAVLVSAIPILRNIVSTGVGLISFLLAGALWLLMVGVAWLVYRPLLGGAMIVGGAVLLGVLLMMKKKKSASASK